MRVQVQSSQLCAGVPWLRSLQQTCSGRGSSTRPVEGTKQKQQLHELKSGQLDAGAVKRSLRASCV